MTDERDAGASTDDPIRCLAEKVWSASRREARVAKTIVLKLKTSEFKTLTRSLTLTTPPEAWEELAAGALSLRERVEVGTAQRFRLVGVGLSNFQHQAEAKRPMFD